MNNKILGPLTRLFTKDDLENDYLHIFGVARKKKKFILVVLRQYLQAGVFEFQRSKKFDSVQELVEWVNKTDPLSRVGISDHGNVLGNAVLGLRRYLDDSSLSEPCLTASIEMGKKEKGVPIQTGLLAKFDAFLAAGALTLTKELQKATPSYSLDIDDKHNAVPYYVQDFDPIFNAALCCLHDFSFNPEDIHSPAVRENAFRGYLYRKENQVKTETGSIEWLGKYHDSIFHHKPKISNAAKIAKALTVDTEWNRYISHERSMDPIKADLLVKLAELYEKHDKVWVASNMPKFFTAEEIERIG